MKRNTIGLGLALALVLAGTALVFAGGGSGVQATANQRAGEPTLAAPAPQLQGVPSTRMKPVHFAFNEARLRAQDEAALKDSAVWIKANPDYRVVVAGFADARGTQRYNLTLGQRRAATVRDYLVERGVRPERIEIVTYGVTDPRCTQQVEPCWARNRRVELIVKPAPPEAS